MRWAFARASGKRSWRKTREYPMKPATCFLLASLLAYSSGCVREGDVPRHRETVCYYDRNADGRVDREEHHFAGKADADWFLVDTNFDGHYDEKVILGVGVQSLAVDQAVPISIKVKLQKKRAQ